MSAAGLGRAAKWKTNMLRNAAALFSNRAADLQSYVYGEVATDTGSKQQVTSSASAYKWLSHYQLLAVLTGSAARQDSFQPAQQGALQCWGSCTPARLA